MFRLLVTLMCLAAPAAAEVTVADDRRPQTFDAPPERVVALSWAMAEMLLGLEVTPVGVAETDGYATWVAAPPLPDGVADMGLRSEPNLEAIADAAPDLILASDQQQAGLDALGQIAPVMWFESFDAAQDNPAKARETFLTLGRLLDREAAARETLKEIDARTAAAGARVHAHFGGEVPPVVPVRLLTPAAVRVHGANSMATAALEGMGLTHADAGAPTDWGFTQRRVEDLSEYEDAIVLHIDPFPAGEELYDTPLWRFMPFVQADRFAVAEPVWTFGGALSVARLAEAFADALTELPVE